MFKIFLIVLLFSVLTPIVKGNSDTNRVVNYSFVPNVETYVRLGLKILHINAVNIVITNLDPNFKSSFEKGINLEGYVSRKEGGYIIHVLKGLTKHELITIISHELIHIKQYETNELIVCPDAIIWQGRDLTALNEWDYESRPWEADAFNNEQMIRKQLKNLR